MSGGVFLVAFSGHLGSGKDTIAPLVMRRMGAWPARHMAFADAIRDEVDSAIHVMRDADATDVAVRSLVARGFGSGADGLVGILWADVKDDPGLAASSRRESVRCALQFWGTFRRTGDSLYWVRETMRRVTPTECGDCAYITDVRMPLEADAVVHGGHALVRLDVRPSVQRLRVLLRDGVEPSASSVSHATETALDSYPSFTTRVDTSDLTVEGVVEEVVRRLAPSWAPRHCDSVIY